MNKKYANIDQTSLSSREKYDILNSLDRGRSADDEDRVAKKAERWVESLFFTSEMEEQKEAKADEQSKSLQKVTRKDLQESQLSFFNDEKRQLIFDDAKEGEKESLALQALKTGQLDFADPRVNVKAASADS